MKKQGSMIEWAMKNKAFPLALAFVFVLIGLLGLFNMPRNEFPEFTIRQGLVIGYYPGANSQEVEEQLTAKVEKFLFSYNEVDKEKTYSYSRDGEMYIYIEVANRVGSNETQQFWNKLKNDLLIFQQRSVPPGVKGIIVNSDFGSTAAMILAVESKTRPYKDLQKHVEEIEDQLRQVKGMAKISHSGGLTEQIAVYVDQNKLAQYGISPATLMQSLQTQGTIRPNGTLESPTFDRPINMDVFLKNVTDIANHIVKTERDGSVIRIKDIARVKREYDDPDSFITANGTKAMIITLEMASGNNIVQFGDRINDQLDAFKTQLPQDIQITKIANQPEVVQHSISHFLEEFGFALMGVIIVTLLLLPFRVASVAAATIPITILATLALMYMLGMELNTVTLAALIIVLGIVVDDPIVVIDNHVEKLDEGQSVWEAAFNSAKELFPSVFTATLAISATFLPLVFFMSGTAKDFLSTFPYTIMLALFLSLTISVLLVPFFNTLFIKRGLHHNQKEEEKKQKKSMLERLQLFFDKSVESAMKHYKMTVLVGLLSIVVGIVLFSKLSQELFPVIERNQFAIEVYLSKNSSLAETEKVVKEFEKVLAKDDRIENYTSFIGTSSPRFHVVYAPNLPAKNYAQILVTTTSDDATEEVLIEYDKKYSELFTNAYLRMKQLNLIAKPAQIEVRLFGDDIDTLKNYGNQIIDLSRETPQTIWSRTNYGEMQHTVAIDVNEEEASRIGLTREAIANTIAMNMEGLNATQVWDGDYAINVKIKAEDHKDQSVSSLRELSIISPATGKVVPLRQVAEVTPSWEQEQIVRRNGMRCLTVRVDIEKGAVANEVLGKLRPKIEALNLPDSITVGYGGEYEMSEENLVPMGISLSISVLIIFLILLWHFREFKQAVLSFITMPLSIFGAALGLILMQYPFGFTSFLGLLALCGIVVRNGIILIDFANELRIHHGHSVYEAAAHAAKRRMRPIFLTSSAAAVGVTPMIISRSTLWGPLGTVIAFGLMLSMVLTLFVLPVLYWLFFRNEETEQEETQHTNANA
ncbi:MULTISPECIES: efflux RND transporter permease subunit [Mesonia]|uniref:Cobalt-zinc-cadmium resistance protein CzcA n=1 Tax=Mesonia oceanica TaxID=2687242 RepID=A0AC61YCB8_9FLAO|nr:MULTISPECIES: efflux RND transporter permease subunit [Mesonia]MAN27159.1 cation transporter [Mesonia sp.]MAQ42044.1 cation transporter [Mesonia sp.]MBJ97599.1 cation transporter [Flavobacteriaceae bacterium]VVV02149.1 Cobalt-zinc-cadmium resistance protein CzcA [Mesonia oceanica]|tara:strand:+ start:37205 stop:40324 length:3120 start_codon:yes stop_codon:yes gene_type:complete